MASAARSYVAPHLGIAPDGGVILAVTAGNAANPWFEAIGGIAWATIGGVFSVTAVVRRHAAVQTQIPSGYPLR
ncbi:hypothetical protein Spa11_01690 [Botrimarina mediterranea]|uniref:Uncharacterized protein n=1 Tax=Botrimarina mediterranea TaxID=2528022 RepID=A0A518K2K1_9BACT|nr:hypothetical protein Spa11_01690 [Botrimarina mediterranea]